MPTREQAGSLQEAEAVVRRVPGVSAVRIEPGERGPIGLIHVLGPADRSPRSLAGEIATALSAELGLTVEPSQVRVAVMKAGQADAGPAPLRPRLKFSGLTAAVRGETAEVRVRLEHERLAYEGAATGRSGTDEIVFLAAAAAVRAVETFLRCDGVFTVKAARVAGVGEDRVVVALVSGPAPGAELLSGSAVVGEDLREAGVRAALDALNRPVSWLAAGS